MGLERGPLLADEALTGRGWCRAHSDLVDGWLDELLQLAGGTATSGIALVAVGGYGRAELCPQSDIDVMLVHDRRMDISAIAERIWYPIWDQELHLGHSVCTLRDALALGADDLDTATSLLSARLVAGDPSPAANLAAGAIGRWRERSPEVLWQVADRVEQRHEKAGDKRVPCGARSQGRPRWPRDVHALRLAEAAHELLFDEDAAALDEAYATLLDARVELQRLTGRPQRARVERQRAVAGALGYSSTEELMARIAEAARTIAWTSDDAWRRLAVAAQASRGRGIPPANRSAQGWPEHAPGCVSGTPRSSWRIDVDAADPGSSCSAPPPPPRVTADHRAPVARTPRGSSLPLAQEPRSVAGDPFFQLIELLGSGPWALA